MTGAPGIPAYLICLGLEERPVVISTAMTDSEEARLLAWLDRPGGAAWRELLLAAIRLTKRAEAPVDGRPKRWPMPGSPAHAAAVASIEAHLEQLDDETLVIETLGNFIAAARLGTEESRLASLAEIVLRAVIARFAPDVLERAERATARAVAERLAEFLDEGSAEAA